MKKRIAAGPLWFLLFVPPVVLAQQADTQKNPFAGNAAAVAAGKTLYEQTCQACHGTEARGDRGPALASGHFTHGSEDSDLFRTIRTGVPGSQMPAFSLLPADNVWRIITYLRSLDTEGAAAGEKVEGNPAHGEEVFWGKGNCGQCHEVNARGSAVGPDLSEAGKNSADYLRTAILDPNSPKGGPARWFRPGAVRVKTRSGEDVTGMVRAQDGYTLLLIDLNGSLRRFNKENLLSEEPELKSLMPADYGQRLEPAEIQDVVAYLKTLKARDLAKTIQADIPGGLSAARLLTASAEPQNWLTYWGNYQGHHFSPLKQITPANVRGLQAQWTVQMPAGPVLESTPLVVDGIMYVTYTTSTAGGVYAIDAASGLTVWKYERRQKTTNPNQINPFNRGAAMLGNRLFFGTLDAALVALDARTGRVLWETQVADTMTGHSLTGAPLAVKDKIVTGVAGGEFGIRGFIAAYDPATGKQLWRFYTVPGPGEPGHNTWTGDSWQHGSGAAWLTGSYDPELNLLYWTVGNPGPSMNNSGRQGDNLFTCSVVALDPDTGQRKWHYQFTPGDTHDWDANEDVVLADAAIDGKPRKLLLQANRNGMYYVLDRTNGRLITGKPFVKQTWNNGFQPDGRPIFSGGWGSSAEGHVVSPILAGGSNWQSPSYDPARGIEYVVAIDGGMGYRSVPIRYEAGRQYLGGAPFPAGEKVESALLAIERQTGEIKWRYPVQRISLGAGVLATGGDLAFLATADGNLTALEATSGKSLWHFQTGGVNSSAAMSYAVGERQFIALCAGNAVYSFALPQ